MIKKLNKIEEFDKEIEKKILVDFYADWCGPCHILADNMKDIEKDINILKVNIDEFEELADKYNITAIPALFVFEKGKVIKQSIGVITDEEILDLYNKKVSD